MPSTVPAGNQPRFRISSFPLNGLFVLAVFYTAYLARVVLLPLTMALFFAFLLRPVVRVLKKKAWIPEMGGAALMLVLLLATAGFGINTLSDPALDWIDRGPRTLQQLERKLEGFLLPIKKAGRTAEELRKITGEQRGRDIVTVKSGPGLAGMILAGMRNFIAQTTVMLILLFFMLASGDLFLVKLMNLYPDEEKKLQVAEIVREAEQSISRYLLTVTLINVGEGVFVGIGMYVIGLPDPVLWGVMAAFLVFIPYLGPLVGIMTVTIVALFTLDVRMAALAPVIYLVITTLQGQFLTPMILGVRFQMNPVVIFIWLLLWGAIWGVIGAIMAVPLLTVLKILCDRIESLNPVSEFLSN